MSDPSPTWPAQRVRDTFLRFFEERGHEIVPSSSLIPANDPTLLFTNAGMNQFKDAFLGQEQRQNRRACSVQKCLRVSGKHNDLEQVGRTPRHHTFFEMLGNFSFGDYFKEEAIPMAWDLMTRIYGLEPHHLWVTVFRDDDAAHQIWKNRSEVPPEQILRMGHADNFWSMGETGPCGPCSEIHVDRGESYGCGKPDCRVGCSCDRYLELWNLVFMEFDRQPSGELKPLAATGVDTGMGLERMTSVLQQVESNYDTDLFTPLLAEAAALTKSHGKEDAETQVSLRVIADHARAVTFLLADGVLPANDGRGYVLRRVLRRAIRHGRRLEMTEPFLHRLTEKVVDSNAAAYPSLGSHRSFVSQVCLREEERFASTLSLALGRFDEVVARLKNRRKTVVSGSEAFRLYDTFGLPLDLMIDEAESLGMTLDTSSFEAEMEQQRTRARKSWKGAGPARGKSLPEFAHCRPTAFLGYEVLAASEGRVLSLHREGQKIVELKETETGGVLLDATPFYAEAGGQVGDRGWWSGPQGRGVVLDCQLVGPGVRLHRVRVEAGVLRTDDLISAHVDGIRRAETARNHTATHLLHAALREVVGSHVKQAGSLVAPDHLRFDFSHFAPLDTPLVEEVENLVNEVVMADRPVTTEEMGLDEALSQGAMALFGEKYGKQVRVVRIGDFSIELCGGTHVRQTGELGLFKVTGERGISSGVRRVEALSGEGSLRRVRADEAILTHLQQTFNAERSAIPEGVARLIQRNKALTREVEELRLQVAGSQDSGAQVHEVGGIKIIPLYVEGIDKKGLRELADRQRNQVKRGVVVLGTNPTPERGMLLVAVTRDLLPKLDARQIVGELARPFEGRGGGRPDLAEAGGKSSPDGIREALSRTPEVVGKRIQEAE